jgi:uncharacterized protein (TIGR03663 family)
MTAAQRWSCLLIVALALALRVWALDFKPAHFDEGVNGSFIDGMRTEGCYRYDPANYHGPLHFYALFAGQQLFGRSLWVLRVPTALIGVTTVALMLAFRRFLPWRVVWMGATAMAISPAMVFVSRYAIHEAWLPFFTMLAVYGGFGIARGARRMNDLWAVGLGLTGMVLTKETYIIHWMAAALALACASFLNRVFHTLPGRRKSRPADLYAGLIRDANPNPEPRPREDKAIAEKLTGASIARVAGVCTGIIVLFYSGFFLHWPGVASIFETFHAMVVKGTTSEEGHNKEFFYWLKLLAWYEWPALVGLVAAPILCLRRSPVLAAVTLAGGALVAGAGCLVLHAVPAATRAMDYLAPDLGLDAFTSFGICLVAVGFYFFFAAPASDPLVRWLCLYGLGSLAAYSFIPYKTPWCIINLLWPLFFALGQVGENLVRIADRRAVYSVGAMLACSSLVDCWRLNFRHPTADGDRYAYVQTTFDINRLLGPVRELVRTSPLHRQMHGLILIEAFPLIWELNEFPNVRYQPEDARLDAYDADFLVVPAHREYEVEERMLGVYFKERYRPRGGAGDCWLYLNADRFQSVLPNRAPEFRPRIPQPNPALEPQGIRP